MTNEAKDNLVAVEDSAVDIEMLLYDLRGLIAANALLSDQIAVKVELAQQNIHRLLKHSESLCEG